MNLKQAKELVHGRLSDKRYEHTLNVKKMAVKLAKIYGEDEERAALAALLHDSAKEISKADVEKMAPYIIQNLTKNPIRVREQRPMVYEVKLAQVDGEELPVAEEMNLAPGATSVTELRVIAVRASMYDAGPSRPIAVMATG